MELGRTSHSVYKIRYHIVLRVKYRKVLLRPEIEECIRDALVGISERYNIAIDELGFDWNHLHIFCGAKPEYSPSRISNIIKSITAKQVFERFPRLRREELWGGEFWSAGKYIGTVGEQATEEVIKRYIQNQSFDQDEVDRRTGQLRLSFLQPPSDG